MYIHRNLGILGHLIAIQGILHEKTVHNYNFLTFYDNNKLLSAAKSLLIYGTNQLLCQLYINDTLHAHMHSYEILKTWYLAKI